MDSSVPIEDALMPNPSDPAGPTAAATVGSQTISADEVALYDRQIRLWGMEAQARMRNAHILIITLRALANEVAKNLVLAGIGSLTVLDSEIISEDDLGAQFFIGEEHVGMNRAEAAAPAIQRLNPRVPVHVDTERVQDKDTNFFQKFDIVIATELDLDSLLFINNATRSCGRPFYAAATYGLYGYAFADLLKHTFVIERDKSNMKTELKKETRTRTITSVREKKEGEKTMEFVTKEEVYAPLSEVLKCQIDKNWRPRKRKTVPAVLPAVKALWQFQKLHKRLPGIMKGDDGEFTKLMTESNQELDLPPELVKSSFVLSFIENVSCELAPVAAILGGVLAQDVINALGKREQPLQNFLVFDGDTNAGPVITLFPQDADA
ncbi:E1 ubiquitin-activating protein aos1 [Rhizina undulata]